MKATIVNVSKEGSLILVRFDSHFGSGWAKWNRPMVPEPGKTYDVEVDIEDRIDFSKNAQILTDSKMTICGDDSSLKLTGVVEEQDDDGMAYLRVGPDCLIMVEAVEGALKGKWLELRVPIQEVELSPIGS